MKYSCLIVDDEPLSHDVLKSHLRHFQNVDIVASFYNAKDAREYLLSHPVDVVFMDIHMPEISGLDLLRSIEARPVTIITTAYRDYALEGFELGVIDYLIKPIAIERFSGALHRAIDFLRLSKTAENIDSEKPGNDYHIVIKSGTKKILVDYRNILFAQGLKDYTILHEASRKYVVKGSVKAFENYLPTSWFIRVHKSFIVAKNQVRIIHKNKIELNAISIPIGRSFKENVESLLSANG